MRPVATRPGGGDAPHESPDYWDGIMEAWEPSPANRLWRAHSDAVNIGLIRRWLEPGRGVVVKTDLFDEAVGQGVFAELAERADRVVGVDVSPRVVRVALERFPGLCGVVAGVEALPFGDGTVDTVFSNSTLDHFASHAQLRLSAAELARVVRPRGGCWSPWTTGPTRWWHCGPRPSPVCGAASAWCPTSWARPTASAAWSASSSRSGSTSCGLRPSCMRRHSSSPAGRSDEEPSRPMRTCARCCPSR